MAEERQVLVPDFVSRHLVRRALQQHQLPSTQVAAEVGVELERVVKELVGDISRLAAGNAQQRHNNMNVAQPVMIVEEDIWQAVHRLGLDAHLEVSPPAPITSVTMSELLLEDDATAEEVSP